MIVADQRDVGRVVEELQGHGYQAISALQEMQAVPGVIALVRLVSSVVTGGLLVICGITSAMFAVSLVRQRSREFGILRAVGWTARRVQASWIAEMMVVCFGGACVGTSLGLLGGNALAQQVRDAVTNGALSEPYVDVGAALMVVGGLLLATGIAAGVTVAFAARSDVASLLRGLS